MRLHGLPALLLVRNLALAQIWASVGWFAGAVTLVLWSDRVEYQYAVLAAWGMTLVGLGGCALALWGWALSDETLMRHDITRKSWFDRPPSGWALVGVAGTSLVVLLAGVLTATPYRTAIIALGLLPSALHLGIASASMVGIVKQCAYNIHRRRFFVGNWKKALSLVAKSADSMSIRRIQVFVSSQTGEFDATIAGVEPLVDANNRACRARDLAAASAAVPLKAYVLQGLRSAPTHPVADHPWIGEFMSHFPSIRNEVLGAVARQPTLTPYPLLGLDAWKSIALYKGGVRLQEGCDLCPLFASLVERLVPGGPVREVMVSVLEPAGHLPPHIDNTLPMLTLHVPVFAPSPSGIRIGNELHPWVEGQPLIIDTTFEHEAWNHSRQRRVNLMIDFWPHGLTGVEKEFFSEVYRLQMKQHLPCSTASHSSSAGEAAPERELPRLSDRSQARS